MTASIAEPRPQQSRRPVLRRLIDILPTQVPVTHEPPPVTAMPVADPAAAVLAERVLRATVEALHGRRSVYQLSGMLSPDVLDHVIALKTTTGHLTPRVHKVLTHPQPSGVLEAVAVVILSTGVRAMAARFEEQDHEGRRRWRCTALQLRLTAGDLATRQGARLRRPAP
ncbi:MAG TPA: Rv3235 family protein [Pseudonocardiaceae bacterium]|nr:Rv3235 family protein [Pseudonocardiaceae bacterium]